MAGREAILWGRPSAPQDAPRRSVLHCIRMLSPFREALPDMDFPASDMAEGQRQFYAFIKTLYGAMYGDPGFFLIPQQEYDDYVATAGLGKKTAERAHETDQKESRLRNRFQQAIRFYAAYLYQLCIKARALDNGVLVLEKSAWEQAREAMEWTHTRGENQARYKRLEALGLDERKEPGLVYVTSREFPKMMYGLWTLCRAKDNKYKYMNYLRLDYRSALEGGPGVGDIISCLSPERAATVAELDKAMRGLDTGGGLKMKSYIKPLREITSGSRWKVEYRYGGKCVSGFYADPDSLVICLYFSTPDRVNQVSARLWRENPELAAWLDSKFVERLCKCPSNRRVQLGDGPRRICGLACRAEIEEPGIHEAQKCLTVLDLINEPGAWK